MPSKEEFDGVIHKYSKGWQLDLMLLLQKLERPIICSTRKPEQIISWRNKQGFWDDRAYKYTGQTAKQFILDNLKKVEEK